ncbi:hypothetical protein Tco_1020366 [Tanacetum coccineum]|uniref:Secreted protein n=1 Tax=Tanacetum coccineum TaxID=301880 RepID=A0ABQ5FZU6_9ASTR
MANLLLLLFLLILSDESVGNTVLSVILFGDIPTVIPSTSVVALETSTIAPIISFAAPVRSKVASRPSSSSEFPIAPVIAPPEIRRRSAILIRPREAIPFGRPYL